MGGKSRESIKEQGKKERVKVTVAVGGDDASLSGRRPSTRTGRILGPSLYPLPFLSAPPGHFLPPSSAIIVATLKSRGAQV